MDESMFGPYRIEELLGRGGMGEVYRAHDTETDREVALKVLPEHLAADTEYQARFRRECRAAARLNEPHVVPIHTFGEIDGRLYLDMRLVKGTDLGAWLRVHGPMAPDVAVSVVGQIAKALDAAHAADLVHRDVKPSNVLLAGVDGSDLDASVFAYLFDFGIARARSGAMAPDEVALTRAGTIPGSPSYVAPERFTGVEGDPRADIYALACVLHQALTARPPFEGDLPALMRAHLQAPPPKPSVVRPGVPVELDEVVACGMAKVPDERYSSAGELATAARAALGASTQDGGTTSFIPTAPPRTSTASRSTAIPSRNVPLPSRLPNRNHPQPSQPHPLPGPGAPRPSRSGPPSLPRPVGPHPLLPRQPPAPPAPPASDSNRAGWIAVGIAAAVVVIGGAVVLPMVLRGSPGGGTAASSATPGVPALPAGDQQLVAGLPRGFAAASCTSNPTLRAKVQAVAAVVCQTGPADGPETGTFTRFATVEQLEAEFEKEAQTEAIPAPPGNLEDCRTQAKLRQTWARGESGVESGSVACFTEPGTGAAYLFWTNRDVLAFGYVRRGDGNAGVLYDWWNSTDFSG